MGAGRQRSCGRCSKGGGPAARKRRIEEGLIEADAGASDAYELFRRGSELLAAHHAHQAVIVLERARDLQPDKGSVCEALGRAYYATGRLSSAGAQFRRTLELDPSNDYAHFGLALCLARTGERRHALGHLRLALVMRPGIRAYQRALGPLERAVSAEGAPGRGPDSDAGMAGG
ncbi:MAG TPA: tetratricopeptide repeat protein [Actinomycetota bacterium]